MNSMPKFSPVTAKQALCMGGSLMFSLGFYRGIEQYNYRQIKNKNPTIKDYATSTMLGIMYGSTYINPAMSGFAICDEYSKIKMYLSGDYDEQKYYHNLYIKFI